MTRVFSPTRHARSGSGAGPSRSSSMCECLVDTRRSSASHHTLRRVGHIPCMPTAPLFRTGPNALAVQGIGEDASRA
jgi:hypothetical protein